MKIVIIIFLTLVAGTYGYLIGTVSNIETDTKKILSIMERNQ